MQAQASTSYPLSSEIESPATSQTELVKLNCATHGAYEAYQINGSAQACPHCVDALTERDLRDKQERDARHRRHERMKLLHATARIPKRFADAGFSNYRVTTPAQKYAMGICCAYADTWLQQCDKGGTLVLTGLTGTGKTHMACAIGNLVMSKHLSTVAFGTLADYGREIRSTYGRARGERSEVQVVQTLRTVDLLLLDDIGANDSSGADMRLLFDLIDGRWRDNKATIVTSNLNSTELRKFLGTRAMERLEDRGTVIAFDWASHRGQQQALV